MSGSRSYRDLVVWQKSMDLAESIYSCTRSFPREEMYGIISQMRGGWGIRALQCRRMLGREQFRGIPPVSWNRTSLGNSKLNAQN